jgi:hypothetical protein
MACALLKEAVECLTKIIGGTKLIPTYLVATNYENTLAKCQAEEIKLEKAKKPKLHHNFGSPC